MIRVAPQERVAPLAWRARDMEDRTSWQFQPTMAVLQEIETLEHWAHRVEDPVNGLKRNSVETPGLDALAKAMGREIDQGTGVAWVRGFPTLPQLALRLTYLKIALVLGSTIDTYGRLYEVQDSGASYRDRPIPVSDPGINRYAHGFLWQERMPWHCWPCLCASGPRGRILSVSFCGPGP